jgi:adenosylmethionine-8-amino-7-oxononanoate aminotransferase
LYLMPPYIVSDDQLDSLCRAMVEVISVSGV